jgi:hypothetical protein
LNLGFEVVEQEVGQLKQRVESLNPYRDTVLDEVADAILKMEGFWQRHIAQLCDLHQGVEVIQQIRTFYGRTKGLQRRQRNDCCSGNCMAVLEMRESVH